MLAPELKPLILLLCFTGQQLGGNTQPIGIFEGLNKAGALRHGSFRYEQQSGSYTLSTAGTASGQESFHFAWRKLKGNFLLQARIASREIPPPCQLGWMIRRSVDDNAPLLTASVRGDGTASLQLQNQGNTALEEVKLDGQGPVVVQLERRGKRYILSAARWGAPFVSRKIAEVDLGDEVYAGLFFHGPHQEAAAKARFDHVRIIVPAREDFVPYKDYIGSNLEIYDLSSGNRTIVYSAPGSLQAPNWTPDGKSLLYNSNGLIYRFDLATKKPQLLPTGAVRKNNNDHVISFDGSLLGLSASSLDGKYNSVVYTVPIRGGTPKQITPVGPSYLHGWSPDGKYLVYTGQRNNEFDIYRIPASGGVEERLTSAPGLDDGPEYSPDGKYIYFNSVRSGTMQIWRMNADGSNQVPITNDAFNNWFPHVSPDGKWLVFLSYTSDVRPEDHPWYKQVYLRLMPVDGGTPRVVVYLYGGQGSINTSSWSPDSKQFAFVSNSDLLPED